MYIFLLVVFVCQKNYVLQEYVPQETADEISQKYGFW